MCSVAVRERGRVALRPDEWRDLAASPDFWRLVDRGIISVKMGRQRAELEAGPHVGAARCGDVLLEVAEKIPGALTELIRLAAGDAFRVVPAATPASTLGDLAGLLVRAFTEATRRYASQGKEALYTRRPETGSLVGGRIDVQRTVGLRARGLRHLVAFDRSHLTHRTPKNRVLFAALHEIENIARMIDMDPDVLAAARILAMHFGDCRDADTLYGSRDRFLREADSLLSRQGTAGDERDLLALASVVLARESFEPRETRSRDVPRAWFLGLEDLFERAVLHLLRELAPPGTEVDLGRRLGRSVFAGPPRHPGGGDGVSALADPDYVLRTQHATVAVGDAKYKEWTRKPARADLYQLLVHARAFDSSEAFLVYPADGFERIDLGTSVTGTRVRLFAVDARDLASGVESIHTALEQAAGPAGAL